MTDAPPAPAESAARASAAARSVTRMFGQRLFLLPATHIAATRRPSGLLQDLAQPWHYWWQAHYLDCLVDAGRRETTGPKADGGQAPDAARLASRLLTGIRLRNLFTFVNNYYDDMAWLALAALRLEELERSEGKARRRSAGIRKTLGLQFDAASTDDLGGGTFWSKAKDFKNTPATAPVALYYARTGRHGKAQRLVDWLNDRLFDPAQGLYLDGIRIGRTGELITESRIFTYNQGPVLGALLELGGQANLERAAAVVEAVARTLTVGNGVTTAGGGTGTRAGSLVLRCEGTGDGGLFTGILARYLALAALDRRLPAATRTSAGRLVTDTAEAFWAGRRPLAIGEPLARNGADVVFSVQPRLPADQTYAAGAAVELSTQLQAWMTLEAAAAVSAGSAKVQG